MTDIEKLIEKLEDEQVNLQLCGVDTTDIMLTIDYLNNGEVPGHILSVIDEYDMLYTAVYDFGTLLSDYIEQ